ncbi:hypothetical protein K474DRAFT_1710910 [Panus rudis PR-1116 ss-1]|nr:hypothetical protein K474DRAFT_1710910 [Panus rudis PR-1116 ss-1]
MFPPSHLPLSMFQRFGDLQRWAGPVIPEDSDLTACLDPPPQRGKSGSLRPVLEA